MTQRIESRPFRPLPEFVAHSNPGLRLAPTRAVGSARFGAEMQWTASADRSRVVANSENSFQNIALVAAGLGLISGEPLGYDLSLGSLTQQA